MPDNNKIIEKLFDLLGQDNVLIAPEHLYVYSRFGKFGVDEWYEPLAVLKIGSDEEMKQIRKAVKSKGLRLIRIDELSKAENTELNKPYLLIDAKKPVTIKDLEKHLSELTEKRSSDKAELKNALSFQHWVSSSIQAQNGFQANARTIRVANEILQELSTLIR